MYRVEVWSWPFRYLHGCGDDAARWVRLLEPGSSHGQAVRSETPVMTPAAMVSSRVWIHLDRCCVRSSARSRRWVEFQWFRARVGERKSARHAVGVGNGRVGAGDSDLRNHHWRWRPAESLCVTASLATPDHQGANRSVGTTVSAYVRKRYGAGVASSRKIGAGSSVDIRLAIRTTAGSSPALRAVWTTSASSNNVSPASSMTSSPADSGSVAAAAPGVASPSAARVTVAVLSSRV